MEAQTRAGPDALERAEGDAFKHERSSHRDILAQRTRSPARHPDVVRLRGCRLTRHAWTFRHPKVVWYSKKSVICDGYQIRAAQNCDERRRARALARLDWRVRACSSSLLHEPIVYPPVAGLARAFPESPGAEADQFHRPAFLFFFALPDPPPNALAFSFFNFAFSALLILLLALICFFSTSLACFCRRSSRAPALSFFSKKYA